MNNLSFVHIADVHLGMSFRSASFSKEFGSKKRAGIMKNLKRVVDYCNDEAIDLLLIAGDFFDGDLVSLNDLYDVVHLFRSLRRTYVTIIAGNHDPLETGSAYKRVDWPENTYIFSKEYECIYIPYLHVQIVGHSWQDKGARNFDISNVVNLLTEPIENLNQPFKERVDSSKNDKDKRELYRIGLFHGDIFDNHDYMAINSRDLISLNLDYIGLGHIHKAEIIHENIVYPGSLEALDFSEVYEHGGIVGKLSIHGIELERLETSVYPVAVIEVNVSGISSLLAIKEKIQHQLKKLHKSHMVRCILKGYREVHLLFDQDFLEALYDECIPMLSYLEVRDDTQIALDIQQVAHDHKDDVIGYFIKAMEKEDLTDSINEKALELGLSMLIESMEE